MVSMVGAGQETDGTKLREPALWQRAAIEGAAQGKGDLTQLSACLREDYGPGRGWSYHMEL